MAGKKPKVPTPRQLPSGNWFVQVRVNGKRVSITEPTERACIARAMAVKEEMLSPVDKRRKPTLSQAIDNYIEARQNILSPATIRGYRTIQKGRFKEAMSRPVDTYGEKDWQRIVNREAKNCSAKTLKNAWGLVSSVINEEIGVRLTVSLPQVVTDGRGFLEPEEIPPFVAAVSDTKYAIPALLALCSLRRSEIMALRWEDVDLNKGMIYVRGAVVPDEHHKNVRKKENKNSTSRRTVPIMIPQLLKRLEEEQTKCGDVVRMHPETVNRALKRLCEGNGLPAVTLHELRHSYASLAYSLKMPTKIAQEIGGWSDDATMRKIYTHVSRADVAKYQNAMADFYKMSYEMSYEK